MLALHVPRTGLPAIVAAALRLLPLTPLELTIQLLVDRVAMAHPGLFDRLGEHANKTFVIDPTDLPFLFVMEPRRARPRITVAFGILPGASAADARITGPLLVLIDVADGRIDGDAMLFSGDLAVEGDVEAALALRNALDDSEMSLIGEATAMLGPLGGVGEWLGRSALALLRQLAEGGPAAAAEPR